MELINERIKAEVENISIVDTHEHTMSETDRNEYAVDFSYLFGHYNSSDLISAGMPPRLLEAVRLPLYRYSTATRKRSRAHRIVPTPEREDMSLEERWQAMGPFWEVMQNTSYAKATLIAVRDLFNIEDLNSETYGHLSQAIADSRRDGWYNYVLKDKAGIDVSIIDVGTADVDRGLFAPVIRMDNYVAVRNRSDIDLLEEETGGEISSVATLVKVMKERLEGHLADGIVGIKSALAYERTLRFDMVTEGDAETSFNRFVSAQVEQPLWSEIKPLQDYLMHQLVQASIELDLPVQIHTGLQEGNENTITNSKPTHLINLFIEYPQAKFDLFYGGYPYMHEWATLAKNFSNAYADMAWVHLISPWVGRSLLHELVETVPGNKIMAFGGDSMTVEITYAHSRMARQVVTRVLSEKISDGYMNEDEAIVLARRMLRDNPASLFRLL